MNSLVASLALVSIATAQDTTRYTHADTLRGSNGPGRAWWDVQFYDLHTRVNLRDSSITGWNAITYRVLQVAREMQIDLQQPLVVDSIVQDRRKLTSRRDEHTWLGDLPARLALLLGDPMSLRDHRVVSRQASGRPAAAVGRRIHVPDR